MGQDEKEDMARLVRVMTHVFDDLRLIPHYYDVVIKGIDSSTDIELRTDSE